MPDQSSKPSQFRWDDNGRRLELRGRQRRRFEAWQVYLPGAALLAATVPLAEYVAGALGWASLLLGLATTWQVFLAVTHALRRAEVEYLWPLEQQLRFGEQNARGYRDRARHARAQLDGLEVDPREVRSVQVCAAAALDDGKSLAAVYLVFADRVILVERSEDHATLLEYAQALRNHFGVEEESGSARPISPAPTEQAGCLLMAWPLVPGALVGAGSYLLSSTAGALFVFAAAVLLVAAVGGCTFWIVRDRLRRACRRWLLQAFGIEARPARRDGRLHR